jgi:hypothetical protein
MTVIESAQPIRRYGPPSSVVWTSGEPCVEEDCAALTLALCQGEVEVIEHGRWGTYNVILRWSRLEPKPRYFLAELQEVARAEPG